MFKIYAHGQAHKNYATVEIHPTHNCFPSLPTRPGQFFAHAHSYITGFSQCLFPSPPFLYGLSFCFSISIQLSRGWNSYFVNRQKKKKTHQKAAILVPGASWGPEH